MPRTISDEEWNFLQGRRQIADMVEPVYENPKTKRKAQALLKEVYPNLPIADYDLEQQLNSRFDNDRKAREESEAQARKRAEDEAWRSSREKVKKQYGFTDEAMGDLEKLMQEKYIGDYEVAATYKAAKDPRTSDSTYDSQYWRHEDKPEFKEIARDPEAWGRAEILGAIRRGQERMRQG